VWTPPNPNSFFFGFLGLLWFEDLTPFPSRGSPCHNTSIPCVFYVSSPSQWSLIVRLPHPSSPSLSQFFWNPAPSNCRSAATSDLPPSLLDFYSMPLVHYCTLSPSRDSTPNTSPVFCGVLLALGDHPPIFFLLLRRSHLFPASRSHQFRLRISELLFTPPPPLPFLSV